MTIGMLWYISKKMSLAENIIQACEYYVNKYGSTPELVMCNPSDLAKAEDKEFVVEVKPYQYILPSHLWVGKEETLN